MDVMSTAEFNRGWNKAISMAAEIARLHNPEKARQARGQKLGIIRRQAALTHGDEWADACIETIRDEERGEKIAAEIIAAAIHKLALCLTQP